MVVSEERYFTFQLTLSKYIEYMVCACHTVLLNDFVSLSHMHFLLFVPRQLVYSCL